MRGKRLVGVALAASISACGGDTTGTDGWSGGSTSASTGTASTGSGGGAPPEGKCRDDADCKKGGTSCYAPGESVGCGACMNVDSPCTSDAECKASGADLICQGVECACSGESACMPGCTPASECGVGATCDPSSKRCAPKPCASGDECPDNFDCKPEGCVRSACSTDADCDDRCVRGVCHEEFGFCSAPPP